MMLRRSKKWSPMLVVFFVALAAVGVIRANAAWDDPGTLPTEFPANFSLPLNTSSAPQQKKGQLTVEGSFTSLGRLCVGQVGTSCDNGGGTSQIVWNGESRTDWAAANIQSYVHLQPPPIGDDAGYVELIGLDGATAPFALRGQAGQQNGAYGVEGAAASSDGGFATGLDSAGAVGSVGDTVVNLAEHYGLYADEDTATGVTAIANLSSALAGYFNGHVRLVGQSDQSDLVVGLIGGGVATARTNNTSEVCLNDVCKAGWQLGGASQWVYNASTNTLWPGSTTRNLSIGSGKFTVVNQPNLTADVAVSGASKFGSLVVGTPSGSVNSCGDGICSANESAVSCVADCDTRPPGNVTSVQYTWNQVSRRLSLLWNLPTDSDLGGTRYVESAAVPPAGPQDAGTNLPKPTNTKISNFLQPGITYYFGLYAYDLAGNFASGVVISFTAP